jgi:uncharacterized repeat protein (TIGR01451 family)
MHDYLVIGVVMHLTSKLVTFMKSRFAAASSLCNHSVRWISLAVLALHSMFAGSVMAQTSVTNAGPPFFCDARFYQIRTDNTANAATTNTTYLVRYPSLAAASTPDNPYGGTTVIPLGLNALGFNPRDGYLYALGFGATDNRNLYRIGQLGVELVGTLPLPASPTFVSTGAVFDAAGNFYFAGQGAAGIVPAAIFRVDNVPVTGVATLAIAKQYNLTGNIPLANIGDFAFSRVSDGINGILYGGTGGNFSRITLNDAAATASVVTVAVTPAVGGIGSAFFDRPTDRIVLFNNGASAFVAVTNFAAGAPASVSTTVANPTFIAPGFSNSATDGASCILAGDPPQADLSLRKSVTPNTPRRAGDTVTFTISVGNLGPNPAQSVTIADPLPAGLVFSSASASLGTYNTPNWVIPNLAVNTTQTLTIVATVANGGSTTNTLTIVNTANIAGSNVAGTTTVIPLTDPVPGNNQDTATVSVSVSANLSISKTNGVTALQAGSTTTYTITVSNISPGFNVANAIVRDPVAPGLQCTLPPTCSIVPAAAGTCPTAGAGAGQLSVANLQSPGGVLIPLLNVGANMVFTQTCGVTATGL